jgi:hypothetical protein
MGAPRGRHPAPARRPRRVTGGLRERRSSAGSLDDRRARGSKIVGTQYRQNGPALGHGCRVTTPGRVPTRHPRTAGGWLPSLTARGWRSRRRHQGWRERRPPSLTGRGWRGCGRGRHQGWRERRPPSSTMCPSRGSPARPRRPPELAGRRVPDGHAHHRGEWDLVGARQDRLAGFARAEARRLVVGDDLEVCGGVVYLSRGRTPWAASRGLGASGGGLRSGRPGLPASQPGGRSLTAASGRQVAGNG